MVKDLIIELSEKNNNQIFGFKRIIYVLNKVLAKNIKNVVDTVTTHIKPLKDENG